MYTKIDSTTVPSYMFMARCSVVPSQSGVAAFDFDQSKSALWSIRDASLRAFREVSRTHSQYWSEVHLGGAYTIAVCVHMDKKAWVGRCHVPSTSRM